MYRRYLFTYLYIYSHSVKIFWYACRDAALKCAVVALRVGSDFAVSYPIKNLGRPTECFRVRRFAGCVHSGRPAGRRTCICDAVPSFGFSGEWRYLHR